MTLNEPIPERMSQALLRVVAETGTERVAIGELFARIGERAHYTLLILFALPNTLPGIPGTSAVLGVPLLYLTLQLALGRAPWLPGFIARRSISHQALASVLERAQPWMVRGERYLKPRLRGLTGIVAERWIGACSVVLALMIMLPIPFATPLPALAIIFAALGLMEEDGLWVLVGAVTGTIAAAVVVFVLWAVIKSTLFVLLGAFGMG
ncbi:exopolysaccharide biosynthesis protein [Paracoccaceae bacterium]